MAGHDRLTPEGRRFFAQIEKLKKLEVQVGYQAGSATDDNGVDMTDIAMWNELGTSRAPARPFLRKSVDENTSEIKNMCAAQLKKLVNGGTAEQSLRALGVYQKGLIQEKIKNGSFQENAESTIRQKGSDKPLIDTGRLRQSADFIVRNKGG